ncbi:MAG: c-type cytochrome [Akkermansiaceae bacterium]
MPHATAESGKKLYTTYCSACHAPDGKGATGGTFPPLAGSPWIDGQPHRAIQTVLHGMTGKVEVLGKEYNLVMPPQGAVLNDTQIASILTYVRSSWGNKATAVTPAQVKISRSASAKRNTPWTAPELLKLHPLPNKKSPIRDLIRYTYKGKWSKMPDFSKLKSTSVEEEHSGLLNLRNIAEENHFAVLWEGTLHIKKPGTYQFLLDSDDESNLIIGGKKIASITGLGPLNSSKRRKLVKVKLEKGTTPIRIEFFEYMGGQGIYLGMSGPSIKGTQWLSELHPSKPNKKPKPVIDLTPKGTESIIYNNFLNGTTPRSLAVGHPNGTNFAFSTKHCTMELLWSGKFINASQHWISRGVGRTSPTGDHLAKLGNEGFVTDQAIQFKGYSLDKLRRPTFRYTIGKTEVTDSILPGKTQHQLIRTITIKGKEPLKFRLASGIPVTRTSKTDYTIAGAWKLTTPDLPTKVSKDNILAQLTPGTHTFTYSLK